MKLAYRACDRSGRELADTVEAPDPAGAMDILRRRGLFVIELADRAGPAKPRQTSAPLLGRSRRLKELAMFTRQLSVLVASGTPLVESLGALKRQVTPGRWRQTISVICARVEEGASLSDAMQRFPEYFDQAYCGLVAAGESMGNLAAMLARLAELNQKQLRVRNSIIGAMVYPALLTVIAILVLSLLLTFVVPRFVGLFETLDVPLPTSTSILVAISRVVRLYWWVVLAVAAICATAAVGWVRSSSGRRAIDTAMVRAPQIGKVVRSLAMARITRLLGVLLDGRVPVLDALRLTRNATRNVLYVALMARAEQVVARGEPVCSAFSDSNLIAPAVYEAMRSGEKSGQLGPLLGTLADFLDDENDIVLRSLTSIIEPVILVFMGLLVGVVAVSLFMPLFDLTAMVKGGGT